MVILFLHVAIALAFFKLSNFRLDLSTKVDPVPFAMRKPSAKPEGDESKEAKATTTTAALAKAESLALAVIDSTNKKSPKDTEDTTTTVAVPKAAAKAKAQAKKSAKAKAKQIAKAKAKLKAKAKVVNKKGKKPGNKEKDKHKKGGKGQPSEKPGHLPIHVFSNAIGLFTALGLLVVVEALCCRITFHTMTGVVSCLKLLDFQDQAPKQKQRQSRRP